MSSTRRSSSRRTQPIEEETKPDPQEMYLPVESDEKFVFSFSEEGLTMKECAEKLETFLTKEQLLTSVHPDEIQRFLTKALLGRGGPLKCYTCDRIYSSATGFLNHISKCEELKNADLLYKTNPGMWLKVEKKKQKEVLKKIVGTNYVCFGLGCSKKFNSDVALINHLEKCIKHQYYTFKDRVSEFRKLDKKTRGAFIREAMVANGGLLTCLVCDREYQHPHGLSYHIDRCEVDKSEQPWKCYRCGFEATAAESEDHLVECAKQAELKAIEKLDAMFSATMNEDEEGPLSKRRRSGNATRATPRKNGTILYRYRKSTVHREFNGIVTKADQRRYESACSEVFEAWKTSSSEVPFCQKLQEMKKTMWTFSKTPDDSIFSIFKRKSVTVVPRKVEGVQDSIPSDGIRIDALHYQKIENSSAVFCGAPINTIKVAPGLANGDDVICVSTFANETDFESDSSVIQFWKHKRKSIEENDLKLWFLLYIPNRGAVTQATWLQKHSPSEPDLVGYLACATSTGEILIYRIDSDTVPESSDGSIVVPDPSLILKLPTPVTDEEQDDADFLNATIKVEGEDVPVPVKIDQGSVPIIKISWCGQSGGLRLAGIDALGAICVWNLDEDTVDRRIEVDWQSPPSDISWLNEDHIAVAFKEKVVKVFNVNNWHTVLEESTMKTAGTRVHTDSRMVDSFFTFQSEYMSFPYPNATSLAYVSLDNTTSTIILVPVANTHQLMIWDTALCPSLGTVMTCGIDGRLVASASGRLLKKGNLPFFANRNVMSLKRRRILKDVPTIAELLKQVKREDGEGPKPTGEKKEPLEESLNLHDDVCSKMWIELTFDEPFCPSRPELSCRDQRIESLNCVDINTDSSSPVSFVGGEAGILFAVSSKLQLEETSM